VTGAGQVDSTPILAHFMSLLMHVYRLRGKDNPITVDYVLPDYTHVKRGYIRKEGAKNSQEQVCVHPRMTPLTASINAGEDIIDMLY